MLTRVRPEMVEGEAAVLDSPQFIGTPTAPTPTVGDNSTRLATTEFIALAIAALVASSPAALDTLNELAAALGDDPNFATTVTNSLAGKQPSNANLTALSNITAAANKLFGTDAAGNWALQDVTAFSRTILAAANEASARSALGVDPSTPTDLTDTDDINDVTDGWYKWDSTIPANAPTQYATMLQRNDGSQAIQIVFGGLSPQKIFMRRKTGGVWEAFTEIGAGGSTSWNHIINGDFDIWQRATSAGLTSSGYVADRWRGAFGGSGYTVTHSQQSFASGQTDVPGDPRYFLRTTVTAAGSITGNVVEQWVEGVETLAGELVTLTFYIKASSAFTLDIANSAFIQNFGTSGLPSTQVSTYWNSLTVSDTAVTTSWKKITVKGVIPSIAGKTIGTSANDALRVSFYLPTTNGISIDIAHVSLVAGDATSEPDPFPFRPVALEDLLCRRYCEVFDWQANVLIMAAYGGTSFGTNCVQEIYMHPKRASATVSGYSGTGVSGITVLCYKTKLRFNGTATTTVPQITGMVVADAEIA